MNGSARSTSARYRQRAARARARERRPMAERVQVVSADPYNHYVAIDGARVYPPAGSPMFYRRSDAEAHAGSLRRRAAR